MERNSTTVTTAGELAAALDDASTERIVVAGRITGLSSVRLAPGRQLIGADGNSTLAFTAGEDGLRLSRDNDVAALGLQVAADRRAVYTDPAVDDFGTLRLAGVTATGQVQILAHGRVQGGHVIVDGLDVAVADTRGREDRPELLGVGALQGAFTLWNQQRSHVLVTAHLRGIAVGREDEPVRGSGVLVAGAGPAGGRLQVEVLETGAVWTDGGIPEGSRDTISGGVFVLHGAHVRDVRNRGPATTYGVNDMVLDNWGTVGTWSAYAPLTSYGRSAVGLVNFGTIGAVRIQAPIETYGTGARGFNVYPLDERSGPTVDVAEFSRITTHGDAAAGIQVGQPIGRLVVHGGVHTHGGTGESLVRGRITTLAANAISVQPGGRVAAVEVEGGVTSEGAGVAAVDVRGEVGTMHAAGAAGDRQPHEFELRGPVPAGVWIAAGGDDAPLHRAHAAVQVKLRGARLTHERGRSALRGCARGPGGGRSRPGRGPNGWCSPWRGTCLAG